MSTDMASFSPNKPTDTDDTEIRLTVSIYQGHFPLLPLLTQYLHTHSTLLLYKKAVRANI